MLLMYAHRWDLNVLSMIFDFLNVIAMYLKTRPCILNLPNEHISGRCQEHGCRTIKMGWVLTYGDHVEITFQMLPKFSEWFHVE